MITYTMDSQQPPKRVYYSNGVTHNKNKNCGFYYLFTYLEVIMSLLISFVFIILNIVRKSMKKFGTLRVTLLKEQRKIIASL